jgi:membrane fusion protein (multidrug efflux system)
MAVDQLRQTSAPRPAEPAGRSNDPNDAGSNAEGRRRTLLFAAILGGLILVGAASFWVYSRTYESTDDAQVDGHLNGITARIDGDVKAVHVEENQSVQAGDVLVELDPRDYEVAVDQARAQLLKAQAGERAENPNLPITQSTSETSVSTTRSEVANAEAALAAAERDQLAAQSRVLEVEANNGKAQADVARYKSLVDKNEVARADYDQVVGTAKAFYAYLLSCGGQ